MTADGFEQLDRLFPDQTTFDSVRRYLSEEIRRASVRASRRLQLVLDRLPVGCVITNGRQRVTYVNPAFEQLFGFAAAELIGKSPSETFGLDSARTAAQRNDGAGVSPNATGYTDNITKDGRLRRCEWTNTPLVDDTGAPQGILAMVRDVTEQLEAEALIRQSELHHRIISEHASDYLYLARVDGNSVVTEWTTENVINVTGYTTEEINRLGWEGITLAEDLPRVMEGFVKLLAGLPLEIEYRIRAKSGEIRWLRDVSRPIFDEAGRVTHFRGGTKDITEWKRLEARFQLLSRAIQSSHNGIVIAEAPTLKIVFVNDAFTALTGFSAAECLDKVCSFLQDHNPYQPDLEAINRAVATGTACTVLVTSQRRDGSLFWDRIHISPVRDAGGQITHFIGIHIDETHLIEAREQILDILESTSDAYFALDAERRFTSLNGNFERLTGRRREDLIGRNIWEEFQDLTGLPLYAKVENAVMTRTTVKFEEYHPRPDRWYEVRVFPLKNGGIATYLQDITEKKKAEAEQLKLHEQLLHAQKMEAIGTLTSGVAHEFNNILAGILGNAELLSKTLPLDTPAHHRLKSIEEQAHRAAKLIRQMLGFARQGKTNVEVVDLARCIREVSEMMLATTDRRIRIETDLSPGTPAVEGDPGQLEQVLLNLAINARDAMLSKAEEQGILRFCLESCPCPDPGQFPSNGDVTEFVRVSVSDTGVGIPEAIREKIFEPFFTTKEVGKGTGLGLAMAYGIVKNHHGYITVKSEPGVGTTFQLYFPACRPAAETVPAVIPPVRSDGRAGRILVVEDEPEIRRLVVDVLEFEGYETVAVATGKAAVTHFERLAGDFDLVILDLNLPELNGLEVFRHLKSFRSDVKAVLMTGYLENHAASTILEEGLRFILQKPFDFHVLTNLVGEVISS